MAFWGRCLELGELNRILEGMRRIKGCVCVCVCFIEKGAGEREKGEGRFKI
jgi:hypothetical protein